PYANICSCLLTRPTGPTGPTGPSGPPTGRRSSTPTSTPSTPRSSSATTPGCGGGRSSWAAASSSPPATRPGPSGSARPWGPAKPDGLLVVAPDAELAFLHPLPVERLWGVGRVTAAKLRSRGITTVGEVAALPEAVLVSMLGPASGRHLHALAHNRDPRPVQVG